MGRLDSRVTKSLVTIQVDKNHQPSKKIIARSTKMKMTLRAPNAVLPTKPIGTVTNTLSTENWTRFYLRGL